MLRSFADGALFGDTYGDGTPRVLALHGWRRDRNDWRAVLDGLDALALDLPGFGASPPPPEAWGSADYAKALLPVLDELAPSPVLAGHSFGGRVAVHLAAEAGDRVGGLLLTGVPSLVPRQGPGPGKPALSFRIARALHRRGVLSDARMEALRQRHGSEDYRAATGVMRDVLVRLVNESYEDELPRVTCPVELVWGEGDTAAPLDAADRARDRFGLPAALMVVPGAGHLTVRTAPADVRAALDRLLASA